MSRLALAAALAATVAAAQAHDFYSDTGCCGGMDCSPIDASEYTDTGDGYLIHATGEIIPYGAVRQSPDDQAHRCVYLGGVNEGKTRYSSYRKQYCFFLPGSGV